MKPLLVIGAGSWGTALAIQSARVGHPTRLWGPDVARWKSLRENDLFLPGIPLPDALIPMTDLAEAIVDVDDVLVVVPSHVFADVLTQLKPMLHAGSRVAWGTKGFDAKTGALLTETATTILGPSVPLAVISGPSFAKEVAKGEPTSVTLACHDEAFRSALLSAMHGPQFSMLTTRDMVGVSIGGAVKNVMALAVGMSDGLGYGANARCALITRGLHEMAQLGEALGADPMTLMGLSGMGDLVLTCTDDQSRNRRYGLARAKGLNHDEAVRHIGQVVEGVKAAKHAQTLANQHQVVMPIVSTMAQVVRAEISVQDAITHLLSLPPQREKD